MYLLSVVKMKYIWEKCILNLSCITYVSYLMYVVTFFDNYWELFKILTHKLNCHDILICNLKLKIYLLVMGERKLTTFDYYYIFIELCWSNYVYFIFLNIILWSQCRNELIQALDANKLKRDCSWEISKLKLDNNNRECINWILPDIVIRTWGFEINLM